MDGTRDLLGLTAGIAADYMESLATHAVFPDVTPEQLRAALGGPLPDQPTDARRVVTELAEAAEAGLVRTGSGRYFGFVIGGALPAALAADWLTSAWDQNAGFYAAGPSASVVEQVTREWIVDLLGLPADASIGFVTGTQMAHVTGLAAARFHVLDAVGWDVGRDGLQGAPRVRVLVGEKRHVTVDRALRLLGFGAPTVVDADDAGRMRLDAFAAALAAGGGPGYESLAAARCAGTAARAARRRPSVRVGARRSALALLLELCVAEQMHGLVPEVAVEQELVVEVRIELGRA
jgi:glutamate/tyrosine decarboxylase-like PLP-dependent enzyme